MTDKILLKFYSFKAGLLPPYPHQSNSQSLMRTEEKDAGFVLEKGNPKCKVLNIRGIDKLILTISSPVETEMILLIAPEHWTLSFLSIITIGVSTLLVLLFSFFYYKTFKGSKRIDLSDKMGVGIKLVAID